MRQHIDIQVAATEAEILDIVLFLPREILELDPGKYIFYLGELEFLLSSVNEHYVVHNSSLQH